LNTLSAHRNGSILFIALLGWVGVTHAASSQDVVEVLGLDALSNALTENRVRALMGDHGADLNPQNRRAAAALVASGAMGAADFDAVDVHQKLERLRHALRHAYFMGVVGEISLIDRIDDTWVHDDLLAENELLSVLAEALASGVITGYDLRHKGVYAEFPEGRIFIYSHSSRTHLKQLVSVLAAHDVGARVYVAPKVSAFLYREGWESPDESVIALPGGVRVVNGREAAVMFEFSSPEDRAQFHEVVLRYAKKDEQDEPGLIQDAWWQPFYYTDQPFTSFPSISLVVLSSNRFEATLTVVHEKTDRVVRALSNRGFPVRVDKVWVNPAFFRFLGGDYR